MEVLWTYPLMVLFEACPELCALGQSSRILFHLYEMFTVLQIALSTNLGCCNCRSSLYAQHRLLLRLSCSFVSSAGEMRRQIPRPKVLMSQLVY